MTNQLTEDTIRKRAYEIYVRRGRKPGRDVQNWLEAEQDLKQAQNPTTTALPDNPLPSTTEVNGAKWIVKDFRRATKPKKSRHPKPKQPGFQRDGEYQKGF